MISYGSYEQINMYYNSIMLYLDGLVQFLEYDLFALTLGYDLDMNCVMLVQLNLLLVELVLDDDIVSIMNRLGSIIVLSCQFLSN